MTTTESVSSTLYLLEGGFRPRPEKLAEYGKRHEEFLPLAVAQPGFRETYGGPIANSPWWFFVAKFASLEDMERWQLHRAHAAVQDEARRTWWTAYYIRKGRALAPDEEASGLVLCETALLRDSPLSAEEHSSMTTALSRLSEFSVIPYETVTGERLPTPYVFTESLGTVPRRAPYHYVLLTYWRSTADGAHWRRSASPRQFEALGRVESSFFLIVPERRARMGLRPDRLQREWMASE